MALFKRRPKPEVTTGTLVEPASWTKRLSRVGIALDRLKDEARDLVVVIEGDEADRGEVVSLLGFREGTYSAGWRSMMFRLNPDEQEPVFVDERGVTPSIREIGASLWYRQMRGIGLLMDGVNEQMLSPSIVVLPSGMVVNTLVATFDLPPKHVLRSYAFSNDQISGAFAREKAKQDISAPNGARSA